MDLSGHDQGEMLPIPITSPYVGAVHGHHHHLHDQQQPSSINGPLPPPPPPPLSTEFNTGPEVKYKECLKNHAASLGGVATDGCGEFMPGGAEGTPEALKCSACTCHRNFHRKEVDGEPSTFHHHHPLLKLPPPSSTRLPPPPPHHHHHHMIMPLGALHASESDEMEGIASMARGPSAPAAAKKKRFRTKFTPEQKDRMLQFAERAGWRLQRLEDGVVQQFCQEIGVKRRVLKVWMHNNKHNLAKKTSSSLQIE